MLLTGGTGGSVYAFKVGDDEIGMENGIHDKDIMIYGLELTALRRLHL